MTIDVSDLTPKELYDLKEALSGVLVFAEWAQCDEYGWKRPEPGRDKWDSQVGVWWCSGIDNNLDAGWYWRIDCGVMPYIAGVSGSKPFETAEECMKAVDAELATVPGLQLVGFAPKGGE